jgi:AcrR family transcriptional regulator
MTTLRLRQKRKREKEILDAAEKLIISKGYINTSIEEIAEKAEVGVGTVYNYFQSKPKLLMALFHRYHIELTEKGAAVIKNPPEDAIDSLCALIRIYFEGPMDYFPKEHLRELIAALMTERISIIRESMRLDYLILDQIAELVKILQDRHQLRKEIKADDVAMLIFSTFDTAGMFFLYDDEASIEGAMAFIRYYLQLIYNGLKP